MSPSTRELLPEHGTRQMPAAPATVRARIDHWARVRGAEPALLDAVQSVSYAQLSDFVAGCAGNLAQAGLGPGCRVGVLATADVAGARVTLAVICSCVLVPINAAVPPAELPALIRGFGLDAIVVGPELADAQRQAVLASGITVLHYGDAGLALQAQGPPPAPAMRQVLTSVALLLRSSGTTGRPKVVAVSHENMLAMARKLGSPQWLGIQPGDRTIAMLPLHYASGLKNLLLVPVLLGGSVAFPPAGRMLDMDAWLPRLQPNYLCTAPLMLRALVERFADRKAAVTGSTLRFITCGSAYLPDELRAAAQSLWGVPVLEFYGLSEAGVMAANPPARSKPGTVGLIARGELFIADASGRELPAGEVGQIVVRGPSVSPGYLVQDGLAGEQRHSGCLATGDLGWVDGDGYLTIAGRNKEVISRGGEKVFPYEVEKALLEHPDLLEAVVFGVPHPRLGEGVAAAVVPKPGRTVSAETLAAFLAQRIARYKIPHGIRVLRELPRGATGKVLRPALAEQHMRQRPRALEPASLIEMEVLDLWRRLLRTDQVGVDDDFQDKGGDSLLAADMLLEVERLTGISLEGFGPPVLTVRAVANAVADGFPLPRALVTPVRQGPGVPLFFCHGDYAARGVYAHQLIAALPDHRSVFLLNCLEDEASSDIEAVAAQYVPEVLRAAAGAPVFVGGFCTAGLVAWQLAHLLRERGVDVTGLLLVETPSLNGGRGLRMLAKILRRLGELLAGRARGFVRNEAMRGFWAFKRKGARRFVAALAKRLGYKPAAAPALQLDRHALYGELGVTYYQRMARFVPPRIDVPLSCLIADEGTHFDTDPSRWRDWVREVRVLRIPGNHYTAVIKHRAALAGALAKAMRPVDR